uniref:Uncharacterized protein n=1 Tax=Acrobeloides nanus TaxID=290746 RepID=A0A914DNS2_9BILA
MWYGGSMTCIILAFDRFFEMCFPEMAKKIFGGRMIYMWLAFPIIYILYSFNEVPLVYNVVHHAFYFDPFYGSKGFENRDLKPKKSTNNIVFLKTGTNSVRTSGTYLKN